jgi:hypothetical protein
MNKDAILATLIGFAIGLTITGIIIVAPTAAKTLPKFAIPHISLPSFHMPSFGSAKKGTPSQSPTKSASEMVTNSSFDIATPADGSIITTETVKVSGPAMHPKTVLITSSTEDAVATVADGTYTATVSLKEGRNDITVTAVSEAGSVDTKTITVYQTQEKL